MSIEQENKLSLNTQVVELQKKLSDLENIKSKFESSEPKIIEVVKEVIKEDENLKRLYSESIIKVTELEKENDELQLQIKMTYNKSLLNQSE